MAKQLTIILVILFSISGCKKEDNIFYIGTNLDFEFYSGNNNLLDPSVSESYNWDNIRIYPNINDVNTPFYKPNLDYPYGYVIYKIDNHYRMKINSDLVTNTPFLLKLNDNTVDKIQCEVEIKNDGKYQQLKKVWYNGVLVWEYKYSNVSNAIRIYR